MGIYQVQREAWCMVCDGWSLGISRYIIGTMLCHFKTAAWMGWVLEWWCPFVHISIDSMLSISRPVSTGALLCGCLMYCWYWHWRQSHWSLCLSQNTVSAAHRSLWCGWSSAVHCSIKVNDDQVIMVLAVTIVLQAIWNWPTAEWLWPWFLHRMRLRMRLRMFHALIIQTISCHNLLCDNLITSPTTNHFHRDSDRVNVACPNHPSSPWSDQRPREGSALCSQRQHWMVLRAECQPLRNFRHTMTTIGGSCHKYHFCCNKSFVMTHTFVMTKHVFSLDKSMLVVTKLCSFRQNYVCCDKRFVITNTFVTTSILLSWEKTCFVMTNMRLLRQTHVFCDKAFVATKTIHVASPASDTWQLAKQQGWFAYGISHVAAAKWNPNLAGLRMSLYPTHGKVI